MSWWWRTKPRSILRTIQWFPFFGELENRNWDAEDPSNKSKKDGKAVHPIRRAYIYNAHSDEDTFMSSLSFQKYCSGKYDLKETESNGRNDKTTFEFFGFGYVEKNGLIKVTEVGRRIMQGTFDDEDFLKQLLKLQFPNNIQSKVKGFTEEDYVYPMEIVCKAIKKFGFLNRSEVVLLFGCKHIDKIDSTYSAIEYFREKYNALTNKNDTKKVRELCEKSYKHAYGNIDNDIASYYDYAEAFCRSLVYTGMFKATVRSLATKIRVPDYSQSKLDMIINTMSFDRQEFKTLADYMAWYGSADVIALPWDNVEARRDIISEKIDSIKRLEAQDDFLDNYDGEINSLVDSIIKQAKESSAAGSISALKDAENILTDFIVNVREREYIRKLAQTKQSRDEILDKYDEIMDTIDMGALWLEVNTWKSLLAISGEKQVKRNFNIEEDLTPKSFAPGIGNTPDMEMYTDKYVIIPEVSLMTGVQQWEHEASSVIDHVLSFIKEHEDKTVLGLFISTSINIRTKWQFFILNRESWITKPVPVVPLTIKQYKEIIEQFYKYNLNVSKLTQMLDSIHSIALSSKNFDDWFKRTENFITDWKTKLVA